MHYQIQAQTEYTGTKSHLFVQSRINIKENNRLGRVGIQIDGRSKHIIKHRQKDSQWAGLERN